MRVWTGEVWSVKCEVRSGKLGGVKEAVRECEVRSEKCEV